MCFINIPEDHVLLIYHKTIEVSGGGIDAIIDVNPLFSVLAHIENDDYYPTFIDKITHLFFCSCKFHCFMDGNKRIAIALSAQLLLLNGYVLIVAKFIKEIENICYHVAAGRIGKELLREIIESILTHAYDEDEKLKLRIFIAIMEHAD